MSMDTCFRCSRYIDSHYDLECHIGDSAECVCESCRDKLLVRGDLVETDAGIEWATITPITSKPVDAMACLTEQEKQWGER